MARVGSMAGFFAAAMVVSATALLADAPPAHADPQSTTTLDEASRLYTEGSNLLRAGNPAEALPLLERSNALVPSPNSALLIARCLRDTGRIEDAAVRFEAVAADAQARVTLGEDKYAATAEAARSEGAAVRAGLGVLRVHVPRAPIGTELETDRDHIRLDEHGTAEVLHRPGDVPFAVRTPAGAAVRETAHVDAGKWTTMEIELSSAQGAPPRAQAPRPRASAAGSATSAGDANPPHWLRPAGVVLGVLGLGALGAFVGFGVDSHSKYASLQERCGTSCGPTDRAEADIGERNQRIANVALVAGATAVVAGGLLVALGWPRRR